MMPPPPSSTLFPYTTLFRSVRQRLRDNRITGLRDSAHRGVPDVHGCRRRVDRSSDVELGDVAGLLRLDERQPCTSGTPRCALDRKSTRLNSSHPSISYAVFC